MVGGSPSLCMFQDALMRGPRLESPGRPDACFLLRWSNVTGNIFVQEPIWAGRELSRS